MKRAGGEAAAASGGASPPGVRIPSQLSESTEIPAILVSNLTELRHADRAPEVLILNSFSRELTVSGFPK